MKQSASRLDAVAVLALVVVGAVLRVWGLDEWAFSPDDALHVAEARLGGPLALFEALAVEDTHPPLHYLVLQAMLAIGLSDESLRFASIVPSLLLIPLLFGLGRRLSGRAAGLFAASIATFSVPLILQARVIRPYSLELLLISAALWVALDDGDEGSANARRRIATYGALMALAILSQYSAAIVIAAFGSVRISRLLWQGRRRLAFEWSLVHVALASLAGAVVWLLASLLLDSDFRSEAVDDWLAVGFPDGHYLRYWIARSIAQCVYFVDPPQVVPGLLLGITIVVGCFAARRGPASELAPTLLAASLLNLLLAMLALYPFSATRHILHLLPLVALVAGAGFQWVWDKALARDPAAGAIGAGTFVVTTLLASGYLVQQDLARGVIGIAELPLRQEHYDDALTEIESGARPGEILVGDKQLAYYAWREGSMGDVERLSRNVGRTRLRGQDFYYYDPSRAIKTADDLARFIEDLERLLGPELPPRLRFASVGWRNGLLFRLGPGELRNVDPRPGDQPLQIALARVMASAYETGEGAGGGLVFSVSRSTLRDALHHARRDSASASRTSEDAP